MARLYRRGGIWWLRWYHKGTLSYRSLKTTNRRIALYHKAQKEREIASGRHTDSRDLTFAEVMSLYLEASRPLKGPETHYIDSLHFRILSETLGKLRLSALNPAAVESCLNAIAAKRELRTKTRNHYLSLLRTLSRWCVNRGYVFEDFTKGIKRPEPAEPERAWLTKEQRVKVLQLAKDSTYYPIIAAAFYTGLRWKELATLEWPRVDFEHNVIQIQSEHAKTKRGRLLPLHPALRTVLWPRRKPSGRCFGELGRQDYQEQLKTLKQWFKAAGVKGDRVGFHTCRHTFVSLLLQKSVSIWKVSEWAGHSEVRITQRRYAHSLPTYDPDIAKA